MAETGIRLVAKRAILFAAVLSGTRAMAQVPVAPAKISSTVPSIIETSGDNPRVVVTATFNGHPMKMMVHSYSNHFAQLRHGQAAAFGVKLIPGTHRNYGIDRGGHVSPLGRDDGTVAALGVGKSINRDAPVSVFEVPQSDYGMLDTGWIATNRVIVDFARNQVTVAPTSAEAIAGDKRVLASGYVAVPMHHYNASPFYFVTAAIGGITREMAVTTASIFGVDSAFAAATGLRHGRDVGQGDGPTGTHVANYLLATPVRVTIGSWRSPAITEGRIFDHYAYIATPRPKDPATAIGGELGGAFLRETGAVIDFGTMTLFVRR